MLAPVAGLTIPVCLPPPEDNRVMFVLVKRKSYVPEMCLFIPTPGIQVMHKNPFCQIGLIN